MTRQWNSIGELRAAYTMRELKKAKRSFHTGTTGLFIRVTLALIFMYLIVISHMMLGRIGPVFISILFLIALFMPYFHQVLMKRLKKHRVLKEAYSLDLESPEKTK